MRNTLCMILVLALHMFTACSSSSEKRPTILEFSNGTNGATPAIDEETGKFFYSPSTVAGKTNLIVYFQYTHLYDSAAIKRFNGSLEDVYKAHLLQYADEHPDIHLLSSEVRMSPDGVVLGHDTYWAYTPEDVDNKPVEKEHDVSRRQAYVKR